MKALIFNDKLELKTDYPKPILKENEALVKVKMMGICNTDFEITKGYMGYNGILGHEFTGEVVEIKSSDKSLLNKRVVGEINCGCNDCEWCGSKLQRHCPNRSTLGIWQKDGCFAQYVAMPIDNLLEIPENVSDEEAVFTEPLAAACEILEQKHIQPTDKVVVLGDGKLGLLVALTLNAMNIDVLLVGKHQNKLDLAKAQGVEVILLNDLKIEPNYDIVVEATGSVSGFETSVALTKPRGTLVLKSTIAAGTELNLAPVVVNEITVLGSRCGQFAPALRLLKQGKVDVKPLISAIYNFDDAIEAFEANKQKDTIKILMRID